MSSRSANMFAPAYESDLPSGSSHLRIDRFDIATIALLVVIFIAVAHFPFPPKKLGDGDFDEGAKSLAATLRGEHPWSAVEIYRLPGAVLYYTLPYLLVPTNASANTHWRAGVYWNMLWLTVSMLLLRRAGHSLGGPWAGKLAALLTLLPPFPVYYGFSIQAEIPAYLGATLTAYGSLKWLKSEKRSWLSKELALTIVGLSLMLLSRTNVVLLFPIMVLAAVAAAMSRNSASEAKFIASCSAATTLIFAAVIGLMLWLPRTNSSAQSDNLIRVAFQGRFQYRTETWDWRFWQDYPGRTDYQAYAKSLQELKAQSLASGIPLENLQLSWMLRDLREHPVISLKMAAVRVLAIHTALVGSIDPAHFHMGPLRGRLVYWIFHAVLNSVNYLMIGLALWFAHAHWRQNGSYWSLWGPWLALVAFHVIVYAEPRYLMPGRPGLVLMSAATAATFFRSNKGKLAASV